ncbi:PepSY-like domain-containing protein [Proteiniphilum sp.]|uniref:PepSY-like domain-containing protein n=1 Tax=Proteiniphilum sp. TaxID=1926877 RepID=UPI002B21516B|nr:PepSY-like domain-containing protein [Proteiniphilum sp.]MEA4917328.1 PepSY-like domain-containing protein [Proteiniphilum sp.]
MKKLHLILLLVVGTLIISSCEKKSPEDDFMKLEFEDLPHSSQEFLQKYFLGNKIVDISLDRPEKASDPHKVNPGAITEDNLTLYVTLENDVYVAFSSPNGNWIYVQADKGMPFSAAEILHPDVYQELIKKEPDAKISMLSYYTIYTIGIVLDNGHKYGQTPAFTYSNTILAEAGVSDKTLESKFDAFLKRNRLESQITTSDFLKITERDRVYYRLYVANILALAFNENGDWIRGEIDFGDQDKMAGAAVFLTRISENELPERVGEVFRDMHGLGDIEIVASYENGYYGFRFENRDLLVHEEKGIMPSPVGVAGKLVADHYGNSYTLVRPQGSTIIGVDEFYYSFLFESGNDNISIDMDMYGNWTWIDAYYYNKGKRKDLILSMNMVEAVLPDKIIDYLHENYKDEDVYQLKFDRRSEYRVYIEKYILMFAEDGRFRGRGEWSIIYPS